MTILDAVLVRSLDVTVRRWEDGGLLLETLIGRYTLNRDARDVWQQIDGQRSVTEIVELLADARGVAAGTLSETSAALCQRLADLRLLERV